MKRFLRNNLIGVIAIALLVACGGVVFGAAKAQAPDKGENPLYAENADHKEVFPEGKGYTLSKEKAQEYQLPEKDQDKQQQSLITGSAGSAYRFSSGGRSFSSSRSYTFKTSKIDMTPTIKTNLKEKQKKTVGESFAFYIQPKLYGRTKLTKDDFKLTVTYGKDELKGEADDSYNYDFTVTVKEAGTKDITVTLVDVKKKKTMEAEYEVVGVKKDVETYSVSCTAGFDAFDGVSALNSSADIEENTEVPVNEIIESMLGSKYDVNGTDGKKITSISGFGKNATVKLSDTAKSQIPAGYTEGEDYNVSYITGDSGSIANDAFIPEGKTALTSVWKIYKVIGKTKTEITNYTSKIKITEDTKIVLQYEIVKR